MIVFDDDLRAVVGLDGLGGVEFLVGADRIAGDAQAGGAFGFDRSGAA